MVNFFTDRNNIFLVGRQRVNITMYRSIQIVLHQAKQQPKIYKTAGMHQLRHSFAIHLLDKGMDIMMMQKLLGHNELKTTLRYLHVTNRNLQKIISPFEDIAGMVSKRLTI